MASSGGVIVDGQLHETYAEVGGSLAIDRTCGTGGPGFLCFSAFTVWVESWLRGRFLHRIPRSVWQVAGD